MQRFGAGFKLPKGREIIEMERVNFSKIYK